MKKLMNSTIEKYLNQLKSGGLVSGEVRMKNEAVSEYMDILGAFIEKQNKPFPDYSEIADDVLSWLYVLTDRVRNELHLNWHYPKRLDIAQIVIVLQHCNVFANVKLDGGFDPSAPTVLMRYDPDDGIFTDNMHPINEAIVKLAHGNFRSELKKSVYLSLEALSPIVTPCDDRNLVPVGNGIYDLSSGELEPFDPDLVFITKTPVNYQADAENPVIDNPDGTQWDIVTWMSDLTDNEEITNLLWQILATAVRPYKTTSKSLWLYSEVGCNGKGTFCELLRQLVGPRNVAPLSVADFGRPFALENLFNKLIVINDENDVGKFIDDCANYKAACTADVLNCDRKHKTSLSIRFNGLIIECMNGFPKTRDKTGSFYRRLLLVPFNKTFIDDERPYIKNDYIKQRDVLEYVLKRVLQMDVPSEFTVPDVCNNLNDEYRMYNNTTLEFFNVFSEQFVWDVVPVQFLYDLYRAYCSRNVPSARTMSYTDFRHEIKAIANDDENWEYGRWTVGTQMDGVEHLIVDYNLIHWMDPTYTGNIVEKITNFVHKEQYTGIRRVIKKSGETDK